MLKRESAVVKADNKASTDLTGKEGYVVVNDSGLALAATANLANAFGVITEGGATQSDVAICGAFGGTVSLKASGTITKFAKLAVKDGGTVEVASAGDRVIGIALEAAVADELFEAALVTPYTA